MIRTYAEMLAGPEISLTELAGAAREPVPGYETLSPAFADQLSAAGSELDDYFKDIEARKPYNSLLLGPPGAGKSYLAQKLGVAADAEFFEFNMSELESAAELAKILQGIASRNGGRKIVLFDEFDLRVGSSAVIRFLIKPIYDGVFGRKNVELGKIAFIFSGSYLRNLEILQAVQGEQSRFDLLKLLYDLRHRSSEGVAHEISNLFHMSAVYQRYRAVTAPDRDVFGYLRGLEKLPDFLSRINGFVIEIPDLSSPLDLTNPWHAVLTDDRGRTDVRATVPEKVFEFAEAVAARGRGARPQYSDPSTPILEYKDIVLKERLLRTVRPLLKRFGTKAVATGRGGSSETLRIPRVALNYLVVAPLAHGMRSLNYLIDGMQTNADGVLDLRLKRNDVARRHIRREARSKDPPTVWSHMLAGNDLPGWRAFRRDREIRLVE